MSAVAKFRKRDAEPAPDKLLTIETAAEVLGMTTRALYHRVARRSIPFRKLGRKIVFSERELLAFIAALPKFDPIEES